MNETRKNKIINIIIGFLLYIVILFVGFSVINNIFIKEVKALVNDDIDLNVFVYNWDNDDEIEVLNKNWQPAFYRRLYLTGGATTTIGNTLNYMVENITSLFGTDTVYAILDGDYEFILITKNYNEITNEYDYSILDGLGIGPAILKFTADGVYFYQQYYSAGTVDYYLTTDYTKTFLDIAGEVIVGRRRLDTAYNDGYENARAEYGEFFPPNSPDGFDGWYGFQDGYDYGFELGYDEGFWNSLNFDAYEQGKKDAQLTALGSFDKWFVPAIIVIIILGGFLTIIQKRKDGDT